MPIFYGYQDYSYYNSYDTYYTPSYPQQTVVDPIPAVAPDAPPAEAITQSAAGLDYQRRAQDAFRAGDYSLAILLSNHAMVEMPRDGKLYLFAAQAFFAVGDFRGAAAAIHQGVSLLEPKDWGHAVENYRLYYRDDAYIKQMDRLVKYIQENPDSAYAHFVRGYHFGFLGHSETAINELTQTLKLESRDELAARLLEHFGGTPPPSASPSPTPPATTPPLPADEPVRDDTT